jgi:hypothetical protein
MKTLLRNLLLASAMLVVGAAMAVAQVRMVCNAEGCNPILPAGACWPGWAPAIQPGVNSIISGGTLPAPGQFALNCRSAAIFNIIDPGDPDCCPRVFEPSCGPDGTSSCWNCSSFEPTLGNFTWRIVCPNTCPQSTFTPLVAGACFPGTVDIWFNVEGTLDAFPGCTFTSTSCIHVQGNVNSCSPFSCAVLPLVNGPIMFADQCGNWFNLDCLVVVLNG